MNKEELFLQEKLNDIGWKNHSNNDIEELTINLKNLGYSINCLQKNFLIKYANIEFNFYNPKLKGYSINDLIKLRNPEHKFNSEIESKYRLSFNPIEAAESILYYVVQEYEKTLNKRLLIIGQLENENISLFISEDGYFYGGYDENIIEYGDSFEKMIYSIIQDND